MFLSKGGLVFCLVWFEVIGKGWGGGREDVIGGESFVGDERFSFIGSLFLFLKIKIRKEGK